MKKSGYFCYRHRVFGFLWRSRVRLVRLGRVYECPACGEKKLLSEWSKDARGFLGSSQMHFRFPEF